MPSTSAFSVSNAFISVAVPRSGLLSVPSGKFFPPLCPRQYTLSGEVYERRRNWHLFVDRFAIAKCHDDARRSRPLIPFSGRQVRRAGCAFCLWFDKGGNGTPVLRL